MRVRVQELTYRSMSGLQLRIDPHHSLELRLAGRGELDLLRRGEGVRAVLPLEAPDTGGRDFRVPRLDLRDVGDAAGRPREADEARADGLGQGFQLLADLRLGPQILLRVRGRQLQGAAGREEALDRRVV